MPGPAEEPNHDGGISEEVNGPHVPGSGTGTGAAAATATPTTQPLPPPLPPPSSSSSSSSSSRMTPKRASTTPTRPHLSAASSAATSPRPSREGSPTHPIRKPGPIVGHHATRSRKNSQDLSPIRAASAAGSSIPTVPSAAAIQRALSVAGTLHLPSVAKPDFSNESNQAQKINKPPAGIPAPKTPRVNSPPPALSSGFNKPILSAARKVDQSQSAPATPSIVVERPNRTSTIGSDSDVGEEDRPAKSGMRTPVRGMSGNGPALETVQESSLPSTPAISAGRSNQTGKTVSNADRPEPIEENPMEEAFARETQNVAESGNESAGKKSIENKSTEEGKDMKKAPSAAKSAKPPVVSSKRSFTHLPFTKAPKAGAEGSVKNMTVETETVSSIPQVALGGGPNERNNLGRTETGGSLRLKPSNETIRPKKEKKRVVRKAPSLNAGNGLSTSRRFHHHPVLTRPPSLEYLVSLPISCPDSTFEPTSEKNTDQLALRSSNSLDQRRQSSNPNNIPETPRGAPRRRSSTMLIPFRGRTASTKADIFEAKVATAVDEANSSDSEETFVYESNPPDPLWARPHRYHSRTPSATSTASVYDNHGAKGRPDGHHSVVGKKSMKFANNYNSINHANDEGTVRGGGRNSKNPGNITPHHHHIGRYGRGGHPSLFDSDSPFSTATKSPQSAANHLGRFSPRHSSPRSNHVVHVTKSPRKAEEIMSYDLEGEGADDERAPLIGSNRTTRTRRRPLPGSVRQMYSEERGHQICGRTTAWTTLGMTLMLIIAAIVTVVILCSKPLLEVRIKDIRNVLASEQEIMLDLHVRAVNPNLVAIQVSDIDVNIFAKSKHVGTNELWRSHQSHDPSPNRSPKRPDKVRINISQSPPGLSNPSDIISQLDGIDEGTDPIDDPAEDSHTMLLGQVFEFDSPLLFDPSPIRHHSLGSVGEVRLAKPGNKTEEGGSQRWEHVIQHDFELIARGVIRYSLPVSSKMHSALIAGRVIVQPTEGVDEDGNMKLSQPNWPFEPRSNVISQPPSKSVRRR